MIELIGTNAGLVWNALNEGGKMSVKAVKKATKIKAEKDMYAAFGWLAKEGNWLSKTSRVNCTLR